MPHVFFGGGNVFSLSRSVSGIEANFSFSANSIAHFQICLAYDLILPRMYLYLEFQATLKPLDLKNCKVLAF